MLSIPSRFDATLRTYENPTKIREDVGNLLNKFPTLPMKEDVFYSNDGAPHNLLCLSGTIPILFRGVQYNTPLVLWLLKGYPRVPPLCYVPPTNDMVIKENHKHVDKNGLCYFPYLSSWDPRRCNLFELALVISSAFSAEPPLYTKPAQKPSQPPANYSSYPVVTPYAKPQPAPVSNSPTPMLSPQLPPARSHKPLPPPPPATTTNSSSLAPIQFQTTSYSTYNDNNAVSYTNTAPSDPVFFQNEDQKRYTQVLHTQEYTKQELIQKMQLDFSAASQKSMQDIEEFMKVQSKLIERQAETSMLIQNANQKLATMEETLQVMRKQDEEITQWLTQNTEQDIDTLVTPSDAYSKQLLNLTVEDSCIEDVIYYLDKGLQKDVVELDVFLKEVRNFSRQQFLVRATIAKVSSLLNSGGGGTLPNGKN